MKTNGRTFKRIPQVVHDTAARYQVNPRLIAAVIFQESKGNAYAVRYDPAIYSRRISSKTDAALKGMWSLSCSRDTERHNRATYWGLMQVLGQTAREMAFEADYLTELLDPEDNIALGTQILKRKLSACGNLSDGLTAYHSGGNKSYADQVIAHMEGIDVDFLLA